MNKLIGVLKNLDNDNVRFGKLPEDIKKIIVINVLYSGERPIFGDMLTTAKILAYYRNWEDEYFEKYIFNNHELWKYMWNKFICPLKYLYNTKGELKVGFEKLKELFCILFKLYSVNTVIILDIFENKIDMPQFIKNHGLNIFDYIEKIRKIIEKYKLKHLIVVKNSKNLRLLDNALCKNKNFDEIIEITKSIACISQPYSKNNIMAISLDGNKDLADYLIKNDLNVNIGWNRTPLLFSIERDYTEYVSKLLLNNANPNYYHYKFGPKIKSNIKSNHTNEFNSTKQCDYMKLGYEKFYQDPYFDNKKIIPLFHTFSLETHEMLLKFGADVNVEDDDNNNALHIAINRMYCLNSIEIFMSFIHNGININHQNKDGDTPLHIFVNKIWMDMPPRFISILICNGADYHIKNNANESVLDIATRTNSSFIFNEINKYSKPAINNNKRKPDLDTSHRKK